jgi:sialic acid synthase SpsE
MKYSVGPGHVTVIAEIGENHLGQMDIARRMIEEATRAGADMVKFQSYHGEDAHEDDPERDWFCKIELSDSDHRQLRAYAVQQGTEFLSSPFSVERARFLCEGLGLRKIKVASSEMVNFSLLDYLNERAEMVFLSTGMATIEEVKEAVAHLGQVKTVVILHCVSQYPTEDDEANLRAISTLMEAFPNYQIGYSDHTIGIDAVLAAVALGATVIEKHFTLAKTLPGTDHIVSATPEELAEMVRRIRRIELLLGSGVKAPVLREQAVRELVRRRWKKAQRSGV